MIKYIILVMLGFILLIKGADLFVDGASSISKHLKISSLIIGLTVVAFGTSLPELAVSFKSFNSGYSSIVLGNVVGSNISNILLILGVGAIISPVIVKKNLLMKEIPICFLLVLALIILASHGYMTKLDGLLILVLFGIYLLYIFKNIKYQKKVYEKPPFTIFFSLLYLISGLFFVIIGSKIVVNNSVILANLFHVDKRIIALTIIAFGTSLPELVTTITSAIKKENEILIGNIIGSNIFNIGFVLGFPLFIFGHLNTTSLLFIDIIFLLVSLLLFYLFSITKKQINRFEGIIFLIIFIIYYGIVCF